MKRFLLIVSVLLAAVVVSCKKETPVEDSLTLKSQASVTVPVDGDVVSIAFNTNVAWTAKSTQDWVTLQPASGEAGDATVKASVLKNEAFDAREAQVTITAGSKTATVTILQGQTNALQLETTSFEVPAEGGTVEVKVKANVNYEVKIPAAIDWITQTKGLTESTVTLSVADYKLLEDRTANITITDGTLSSGITITQKAFNAYFELEGDYAAIQYGGRLTIPQEGGTFKVGVNTNLAWRAHYDEEWPPEDTSWLEFKYDESSVTITVQPNESFLARDNWIYMNLLDDIYGGAFGGYFQVYQEPVPAPLTPELQWSVNTIEDPSLAAICLGYNRLAFTLSGALLVSDGASIHAINPADGSYWKNIVLDGIAPQSIDVDDAGNIIIVQDTPAPIDWGTGELLDGQTLKVYTTKDVNEPLKVIELPNGVYGTLGGVRARGDIATKGAITGVVAESSYWFGYDMANYEPQANYYGTQCSGPGAGPNPFWSPDTATSIAYGEDLHDGILYRGYDGAESVYYRHDAYTPKWVADMYPDQVQYEPWTLITNAGSGGNENQNNMDVVDYKGKKILAMTQGYHFTWAGFNADIYVLDITDVTAPQVLATIRTEDWIKNEWPNGINSADVLLREGEGCLELYAIHSGLATMAKFIFDVE